MSDRNRNETKLTTPSDTEVRVEREFEAPRELVWECFADPDLLSEWLGPRYLKMKVEKYDFEPGGEWKYIHSDEAGNEYVFFGEFLELRKPEYMKQSFNFMMEPQPPASIDEAELVALDGDRTLLVTTTTFESKEDRDGMIQSGMERGISEGNEQLDELLARKMAGAK